MIIAILISMACAVGGQIYFKRGMNRAGRVSRSARRIDWRAGLGSVVIGLTFYGLSTVLWLYALSRVELSYAYPFVSLAFVAVMIGARVSLGESLPVSRVLGAAFIVLGVFLVGLSA